MNTLIINLFAGPGAGKSTGACHIFSRLKQMGIDCEYISEFAKEKVWEHNKEVLKCQFYISGKQAYKISRVNGKVDVIITDSPILLGAMYDGGGNPHLRDAILDEFNKYNNINFFITRVKGYNPNGRVQTEEEAIDLDKKIKDFLIETNQDFIEVDGDDGGYEQVIDCILKRLGREVKNAGDEVITGEFLATSGGQFVGEGSGITRMVYRFSAGGTSDSFLLTWNEYDGTWVYEDFRNRLYGLRFKKDLSTLLKLVGKRWEDYFKS